MKSSALIRWFFCFILFTTAAVAGCTSTDPAATKPVPIDPPQPAVQPQSASPRTGGELVIASPGTLPAFDPYGVSKKKAELNDFEWLSYRGLLSYGDDQTIIPELAAEYRVELQNGKPVVVLTLRQGAVWSDGKPVTADDVLFTYEEYARPHYYGVWRNRMHLVDGISAFRTGKAPRLSGLSVDAKQGVVRITLQRDDITFLQALTAPLLPKHQLGGKTIGEIDALSRAGSIVGAGPFQLKTREKEQWTFASHPGYYGGKPHIAEIRVKPISSAEMAEQVKAGSVQLGWISPEEANRLQNGSGERAKVMAGEARGYHLLGFNLQSQAMQDPAVRRALSQALSPETIAREHFFGLAKAAKSPLPDQSFAYQAGAYPGGQPEAARDTLVQKGYSTEKPLALTLVYPAGNAVRERLVEALLQAWQTLPLRVEKKPLPPEEFTAYLFGGSPLDLYLYGWEYPQDPAELIEMWHTREKVGERGYNASRYQNPQADRLLERGQLLLPADERKKLFVEWQQLLAADLPMVPLVEIPNHYYVSERLQGVEQLLGMRPFRGIEKWWLQ
ncbi:ABC transporter substrate-binding protein [Brevibacillus sp. H7]|uniref:ABC transporter substrate-binding protein n=1 Tax=Brevibacillus sp. H7 TaxID=3349138 RepID=UPI0038051B01